MKRMKGVGKCLALCFASLLAACVPTMRSDVVSFHEGPLPMGERIRVEAVDGEKGASLEFRRYADMIREQLRDMGFEPVDSDQSEVELIAEVDYSIEPGPADLRLYPAGPRPFVRYHFYYRRFRDPFYFGFYHDWEPEVRSTPTWVRKLEMNIVRADDGRERIFEGRVQSVGRQSSLPEIMPYLITAMFANFPGENGVTKVVTIEMDQ